MSWVHTSVKGCVSPILCDFDVEQDGGSRFAVLLRRCGGKIIVLRFDSYNTTFDWCMFVAVATWSTGKYVEQVDTTLGNGLAINTTRQPLVV